MSPENQWLEDVFPIELIPFLGDMLVFGGVTNILLSFCWPIFSESHITPKETAICLFW